MKRLLPFILLFICSSAYAYNSVYNPQSWAGDDQVGIENISQDVVSAQCASGEIIKFNGTIWACANDNASAGGGNSVFVSEDATAIFNNETSDMFMEFGEGFDWSGSGQRRRVVIDTTEVSGDRTWSDGSTVSFDWVFSVSGSNPSIKLSHDLVSVDATLSAKFLAVSPETNLNITAATDTIVISGTNMELIPDADYVMISTPTIPDGRDGHIVFLHNESSFTIDVQDESILSGSNISLGGAEGVIRPDGIMSILWDAGESEWKVLSNPNTASFGANASLLEVRNTSGSSIAAGKAVYITGWNVGQNRMTIDLADADDSTKMPAVGITNAAIANGANGTIIQSGEVVNAVDTSSATAGDGVYVDSVTPGDLVFTTKPLMDLVQRIGTVARSNATNGVITVTGAGRANDNSWNILATNVSADTVSADTLFSKGDLTVDPQGGDIDFLDNNLRTTGDVSADTVSVDQVFVSAVRWDNGSGLIKNDFVSNDQVAPQAVSTDQIQASNKPVDGQVLSYNASALKGKWVTPSGGSGTWVQPFVIQSGKLTGDDITAGMGIDAGQRPWRGLFDDTTEEMVTFQFVVDPNYAAGTATLEILYSMDVTQSGDLDVKFDGKFMCTSDADDEDFNTDGFDTEQSVTVDLDNNQVDDLVKLTTITFTQTQADEMAVDDICRFAFNRDPAVANDAAGDVQILGLSIHE